MSVFKNNEAARQQRQAHREAEQQRSQDMKLARPALRALGQGPVAVVVMKGAETRRKQLLAGIKHSFPPSHVLQLNARRVQRLDKDGEFVDDTMDKLRQFRRGAETSKAGRLVVFTGTRYPQPDTVDRIGRGTPEIVERITSMIKNNGHHDPWFMFVGDGKPADLPSSLDFPRDLDRGILDTVNITYALDERHGLKTVLPPPNEIRLTDPESYRPLD